MLELPIQFREITIVNSKESLLGKGNGDKIVTILKDFAITDILRDSPLRAQRIVRAVRDRVTTQNFSENASYVATAGGDFNEIAFKRRY